MTKEEIITRIKLNYDQTFKLPNYEKSDLRRYEDVIVNIIQAILKPESPSLPADAGVRPAILKFAIEMERVLKENDHKTGWEDCDFGYLLERLREEVEELYECFDYSAGSRLLTQKEFIIKECVDVANYCMMIADNLTGVK